MTAGTTPAKSSGTADDTGRVRRRADRLGLYRILASIPALASYRSKFFAAVAVGTLAPAFLLVLVVVLGAGRLGLGAFLLFALVLALLGGAFILWAVDRLLVPIELAEAAIDDVAFDRPVTRAELHGTDAAAQVLRGVTALAQRVEREAHGSRERGVRDELTGLLTRTAGRERAQKLIDEETRRGQRVRILVADVDAFTAFNARHGAGYGDAMLKAIAGRIGRVAGDQGAAMRWSGDAFVLVQSGPPDDMPQDDELLARPIVVKGVDEPLQLAIGVAAADERVAFEQLVAQAEADLRARQGRG